MSQRGKIPFTRMGKLLFPRNNEGKWRFDNNANKVKIEDNSEVLAEATPANITIDYILEERSREYFGEGYRRYDLVRTQGPFF